MELRQYWHVVWKRWWVIVLMLAVVLIVTLITYKEPAPVYQAGLRFAIGIEGTESVNAAAGEGRSDAWLASEYLADDLSQVLRGGDFAAEISRMVEFSVPAGVIFASREHRIMSVSITWGDHDQAQKIAEAVAAAVEHGGAEYFPQLEGVNAQAVLIDGPGISVVGRSLRDKLDLPIRLFLAPIAGVAVSFFWDYLDDTVRGRPDLENMGVKVLGEIPRPRVGRRRADS